MSIKTTLLTSFFALFLFTNVQSQDCNDVLVTYKNVRCVEDIDGDYLEFEMTATLDGVPLYANTNVFVIDPSNNFQSSSFGGLLVDKTVTGDPPYSYIPCNYSNNMESLEFNLYGALLTDENNNPLFDSNSFFCEGIPLTSFASTIPTMGQWGIIILGILVSIFGVVMIRRQVFA